MIDGLSKFKLKNEHYHEGSKTIFTDLTACLKATSQWVMELSKSGSLYEDEEFGPSEEDPFGQKSIYYDQVMPGYPLPEDIVWLRMHEIS